MLSLAFALCVVTHSVIIFDFHFSEFPLRVQILNLLSCCRKSSSLFLIAILYTRFAPRLLIRSSYCCKKKFWFAFCLDRRETSALISLSTIDCPITTSGRTDLSWRVSLSSHLCKCSVKTKLISGEKKRKSFNRLQNGSKVNRQFSMSFASEFTSGR